MLSRLCLAAVLALSPLSAPPLLAKAVPLAIAELDRQLGALEAFMGRVDALSDAELEKVMVAMFTELAGWSGDACTLGPQEVAGAEARLAATGVMYRLMGGEAGFSPAVAAVLGSAADFDALLASLRETAGTAADPAVYLGRIDVLAAGWGAASGKLAGAFDAASNSGALRMEGEVMRIADCTG